MTESKTRKSKNKFEMNKLKELYRTQQTENKNFKLIRFKEKMR